MMRLKRILGALLALIFCGTMALAQTVGSGDAQAIKRGNLLYARAEYEAAIGEYQKVREGAGEAYAQALYNTGVCDYELGRTEEAVRMYRAAVEARKGSYPKALYALGVALEVSGKLTEAKEAYRRAVAVSGGKYTEAGLAVAHYRLALIEGREGNYERAGNLFREALARSVERFPAGHNNLGVMLALAGETVEAEREFETALRQSGANFKEAAYNLKLCRALSKKEESYASLKVVDSTFVLTK